MNGRTNCLVDIVREAEVSTMVIIQKVLYVHLN